jgi:pimeloyl-ACP methyl ester carboxylesterase
LKRIAAQDGLLLAYRDYPGPPGEATPVVCLPGASRNAKDFSVVAKRLSRIRRVVCVDYRGRGRSDYDSDWRNYAPATHLRDLRQVLAASGIHAAVFVGTSLGGILAMAMGVLAPTVLRGVVLNDIGPEVHYSGRERVLELIGKDRSQPDWDHAVRFCKRWYAQTGLDSDESWRRFAEATFRHGDDGLLHVDWDTAIAKALASQPDPPDLWPLFHSLRRLPILSVRGALSDILTSKTQAKMLNTHPDMKIMTVDGVGHAPSLEEPEVEIAIDELLSRVD